MGVFTIQCNKTLCSLCSFLSKTHEPRGKFHEENLFCNLVISWNMAITTLNWKPVKFNRENFDTASEDLIGIEECTDYEVDIDSQSTSIQNSNNKRKLGGSKNNKKKAKTCLKIEKSEKKWLSPSKCGNTTEISDEFVSRENNPKNVYSLNAWEQFNLPSPLVRALQEENFNQPTDIQCFTLPAAIIGKRDIMGAAETGSGKTLAFGLPILSGIIRIKENENLLNLKSTFSSDKLHLENEENLQSIKSHNLVNLTRRPLYGLIITPTRELAVQVKNHLVKIAKYTDINIAVVVGGMAAVKQERLLSRKPEIVVGTPGRLWELIQNGNEHLSQVENIRYLAIDETDRMLERGHFQELQDLLDKINLDENKRKQRQNFVFSATLTLIHDIPKHTTNKSKLKGRKLTNLMSPEQKLLKIVECLGITNPKIVDLSEGKGTSGTLTESRITCSINEKDYYIYYFLTKHQGRTLIFCNSIGCVKRLTNLFTLLKCNPIPLHASMQQRQRLLNLERFTTSENGILIATDVAARGLDIPQIKHVLHYQIPRTCESYVHRSGRTARASKEGLTVLVMEPNEFGNYLRICKNLDKGGDLPLFPIEDDYLAAVKERVNLARILDKSQLQIRKAKSEEGWLQKAAKEMDLLVDELPKKYDHEETTKNRKINQKRRRQLTTLLDTTILSSERFSSIKYPQIRNLFSLEDANRQESALVAMQNSLQRNILRKTKSIPLFKPNYKHNLKEKEKMVIKLKKNKN